MRQILHLAASIAALSAYALFANAPSPRISKSDYERPTSIPENSDNPLTKESVLLGKTLFFDPRISRSGLMSCATCHNPSLDWEDGMETATGHGHQKLSRHTPTILNTAWNAIFFWDGRAETLEEQALGPIQAEGEMNMSLDQMEKVLNSIDGYKPLFEAAYPGEGLNRDTVAKAIANFERTIVSSEAPFDRWVRGDESAISEDAKAGFHLFNSKARCASCHSGWNFTDYSFHDIGLITEDKGLGSILGFESMNFAFKTPTLRNVSNRAPYMHNGSEATLEEVIDLYDQGGRAKRPTLSNEIAPLGLSDNEKSQLIEFLNTLTSEDESVTLPNLPIN